MVRVPPKRDFPKIRRALVFYKTFAYATGVALLLLCVEIVLKYVLGYSVYAFGSAGALALVPNAQRSTGIDLSMTIQFVHGYLYLLYLISDFVLVTMMRYPITRFIVIALGGVVPTLSFITERTVQREIEGYLNRRESTSPAPAASGV